MKRKKKKKNESNIIKMTFGKNSYVKDDETDFIFAWLHPIISCRLCIKYFIKWITSVDSSLAPTVHRYYILFFTLILRSFLWIYIGMGIGVISNDKSDGMRLVTEIPMTIGMSCLSIFGLLLVIRIVISFFELIRLFKKDNLFLYGLRVTVVYGFIGMSLLGSALW
ncbi:hypothetical protein QUF86_02395 [Peribacillus sp. NJ11]|uniref:hypothetical protein n=1 Tax=Peribacillus sp. NJ11 TaxID=3055861 RepID=UPI0025A0D4E4|nr:hypothetical protein [Peribacillus sp. NJ11]MDM5219667.1 hypothetical protein [Peribacillus sp. NJ11]